MSNEPEVRAVPIYGGFTAQFKRIHRCDWVDVEVDGKIETFDTVEQAEVAAYRALMAHLFGHGIVRMGDKAQGAKAKAEKHFIFPGRGRKVEVGRR